MVLPEDILIRKIVPQAKAITLDKVIYEFRQTVTNSRRRNAYLIPAQQLYNWIIAPFESELEELDVDTLIFSMDAGLRTIPMAALQLSQR